jgi:hypothetical protein
MWGREGFEIGPADVFLQSGGGRLWGPALRAPTGQAGVSRPSETGLAANDALCVELCAENYTSSKTPYMWAILWSISPLRSLNRKTGDLNRA